MVPAEPSSWPVISAHGKGQVRGKVPDLALDRFYGLVQSPARPRMAEGGPAGWASVRVS